MDPLRRFGNLLRSDGTNQLQRTLPALERDYVLPDERDLTRLLDYAKGVAAELRFHNVGGQPTGHWAPMFDPLLDVATASVLPSPRLEALLASTDAWPPHLALLLAFLRNFGHLQRELNELPSRHLAFYYGDFLKVVRKGASSDRLHVVFELARSAGPHRLEAGTVLDAGKDARGRSLSYALQRELIVTHAQIADVYRLVAERDKYGRRRFFRSESLPEQGSWPTFGQSQFHLDQASRTMQEVDQGFALASPLFRLAEGERRIAVTGSLESSVTAASPQNLSLYARVELTGDEGWFAPYDAQLALEDVAGELRLRLEVRVVEGQPAVTDFSEELHEGSPAAPWPVMRCLIRSDSGRFDVLDGLALAAAEIEVSVTGMQELIVQNDRDTLEAGKPIPLFGSRPRIGSSFYIGSQEVFSKRLTALSLHLEWQDLPQDLLDHYIEYFDFVDGGLPALFRGSFEAEIDLLHGRSWNHRLVAPQDLFAVGDQRTISLGAGAFTSSFGPGETYEAAPHMAPPERYEAGTKRGFLRLKLSGPTADDLVTGVGVPYALEVPFKAFGHDAFAARYARQAMELARWDGVGTEPALPNEPYTPTLASLTLDYSSREHFTVGDVQAHERFYTLGPFGYTTAGTDIPARLVPEFVRRAALYLGIEDFAPPGDLPVLFKLDEGTATVPELLKTSDITWRYLSGDRWIELPGTAVRADETLGFQQSGVVSVSIGRDATDEHTAMPSGRTWLAAETTKSPQAAPRTIALHAQAATAVFTPEAGGLEDFEDHLAAGIAANTVSKLKRRRSAIRKVAQPYASFGGKRSETDRGYFERTSERLRHRRRAVTGWDFERLVLDRFPDEVFKVKCLAHSDETASRRVGELALVIVPDLRGGNATNPLEPRAGEVLMEEIRGFIAADVATPFASVHVIHPVYERILVEARVAFRPGYDAGYYAAQLDEDLQRFLSPWAFEEGQDIVFGARIYKSELLKFMEDREYVDYVTRCDLYHAFDGPPRHGIGFMEIGRDFMIGADPIPAIGGTDGAMAIGVDFVVGRGVESAATTQPHAVIVSHPQHRVEPIVPGTERCTGVSRLGIGYMTVGLDFDVHAS